MKGIRETYVLIIGQKAAVVVVRDRPYFLHSTVLGSFFFHKLASAQRFQITECFIEGIVHSEKSCPNARSSQILLSVLHDDGGILRRPVPHSAELSCTLRDL